MKLIHGILLLLVFATISRLSAQETDPPQTAVTGRTTETDDPWAMLDLTGQRMKPALPAAPTEADPQAKRRVPLWLPIGGGIVLGGAGAYLLLDEPPPPPMDTITDPDIIVPGDTLIARDDVYALACLPPFTLRPLENDQGTGLRITAIGPTGLAAVEMFGTDALIITDFGGTDGFSFTISVQDAQGNTATSDVFVTVLLPEISALDDTYTTPFASPVDANILTNDTGENLRVADFVQPSTGGSVTLVGSGAMTFTPAPDFVGTTSFIYTAEDDCRQRVTATVTITVDAPDCTLSATLTPTPADCGLANGTVTTTVDPAGAYTYNWSNGATTTDLESMPPGAYSLIISSNGGLCSDTFATTITEAPFTYLLGATFAPADCTGGGELSLELAAPENAPLVVLLSGPAGTEELLLETGTTDLSNLLNLLPGNYSLSIYPQNAGVHCAQSNAVTIPDVTPVLTVADDAFSTPFATPLTGNFLSNDSGLAISITNVDAVSEGSLIYNNDGSFTYTPATNYTGTLSFDYQLTDACGQTATGTVTVTVGEPDCDFTVQLIPTAANCGLADGSIATTVSPEGNYAYLWSDDSSAATAEQLAAGTYQLTVTSNGGLCEQTLTATVDEIPGNYLSNVITTPGTCLGGGNIQLTLLNPAAGNLHLAVTSPGGTQDFSVPPGPVSLNTLLSVTGGNYTLSVYPEAAAAGCSQFVNLSVPDNTPELQALNDSYGTAFETPVSGNVRTNDSGLQTELINTSELTGGTLSITADGGFVFTPAQNFTGMGGFVYTLLDACGNSETATVLITVAGPDCNFSVNLTTSPANCGFANGGASVTISPENEIYTYAWSNGGTTAAQTDLSSGLYTVTITSNGGLCGDAYSVFVPSLPINYIYDILTFPGDCTGGGNILLDLNSPDGGAFNGVVTGPEFSQQVVLNSGLVALDSMFNLVPGNYNILVYPQGAGPACLQEIQASITDITPPLSATGDLFTTPFETPLTGNVLTNDNGLDITLAAVGEISNGSVIFTPDGNFTYTPDAGFVGIATFVYTVEDACGTGIPAQVNITVEGPDCSFSVSLDRVDAVCGLNSGSISSNISPDGDYDYLWSTGATSTAIGNLAAGPYGLTVTSNGGLCSQTFLDTVLMAGAQFVDSLSTAPGDCAGNGSIIIAAYAPDNGNLALTINGPSGSSDLIIPSGFTDLGDLVNLPSGVYDLFLYPESIGSGCSETTFAEVGDNTPDFIPNDDNYSTGFQVILVDNVLTNDEGLELEALNVVSSNGGTVELSSNGDFVFTPNDGFTGTATFVYSAMDACTEILEATVTIEVGAPNCVFTAGFTQTDAGCGYDDGTITAQVAPAGTQYTYLWSTGADTDMVGNLFSGEYAVTITDTVNNCPLSFSIVIGENEADYLRNLSVTAPTCDQAAEVTFILDGDPPGLHTLDISAPDGSIVSVPNFPGGTVQLSDYVTVSSGTYILTAYNQNIGTICTDTLPAVVPEAAVLEIGLVSITQPSGGGAADGSFTVEVTQATTAPYQVTLNGQAAGTTDGSAPFTVSDLGPGTYDLFLTDAAGCTSNVISVELISNLQIRWGWAPAATFMTDPAGEPRRSTTDRRQPTFWRPYLQLAYAPGRLAYRLRIAEAIHYPTAGFPRSALHASLQLTGRAPLFRSGLRWSTGPAWVGHHQIGARWEAAVRWQAPGTSGWHWQLDGGWGRQGQLNLRLVWER